jgi:hypothetical protein
VTACIVGYGSRQRWPGSRRAGADRLDGSRPAAALEHYANVVAAVGGSSVIGTAKAMAMLLGKGGDLLDYLEVVSSGRPITQPAASCVAMASRVAGVTIRCSQATGQQLCQDGDHGAAGQARLRVSRRPAQDSDLMPEHQDLPVLAVSLRREHELAG